MPTISDININMSNTATRVIKNTGYLYAKMGITMLFRYIFFLCFVGFCTPISAQGTALNGDIDNDRTLSVKDVTLLVNNILGAPIKKPSYDTPPTIDLNAIHLYDIPDYYILYKDSIHNDSIWGISGTEAFLMTDPVHCRCATPVVPLDRTQDLTLFTNGNAEVLFFDENKNYLTSANSDFSTPIRKNDYPATARFVAFNYYPSSCCTVDGNFHVGKREPLLGSRIYNPIAKLIGERPRISIYQSDSQEEIFQKMVLAFYTKDCDVIWEKGTYTFDAIFDWMNTIYEWNTAYELPLGGNCRYYLNYSTIIGKNLPNSPSIDNTSVFGSHRCCDASYAIYDGTIIAEDIIYCIHDESSGGDIPYTRRYENLRLQYNPGEHSQYLSKCIGGGTGQNGECILNKCTLINNLNSDDASWHGNENCDVNSLFSLIVTDCYFHNQLGLHWLGETENAVLIYKNNSAKITPSKAVGKSTR